MKKIKKLLIKEAIKQANAKGINIDRKSLSEKIWTDTSQESRYNNMNNLCSGKTKRIALDWVVVICNECQCSPNFLFGYGE